MGFEKNMGEAANSGGYLISNLDTVLKVSGRLVWRPVADTTCRLAARAWPQIKLKHMCSLTG